VISLRGLGLFVCVLLAGCTQVDFEDEGCAEMREINQRFNRIEQWGNSLVFQPAWRENDVRTLLQHKPVRDAHGHYCVPQSQALLLAMSVPYNPVFNAAFRWQLNVGGGGGARIVKLDAFNIQQLALAAENVDINVLCENAYVDLCDNAGVPLAKPAFTAPAVAVTASCSLADGNVSSSQASYTQQFSVGAGPGTTSKFFIPPMASGFRILGSVGGAAYPLVATTRISIDQVGIQFGVAYTGDQLVTLSTSGDYIPLPGQAASMSITNGAGAAVSGVVQWSLDL
jgi:hypothetical protein